MLKDKVAVVTGASKGIGRAIALRLAENGVNIALISRNKTSLTRTKNEIEKTAATSKAYQFDLLEIARIESLVKEIVLDFGKIDILINNAGIAISKPIEETTEEEWDKIITINAKAPFFLCKAAIPYLSQSENANIINITSVVAKKGYPNQSAYTASKHALYGFSKVLAKEVQDRGINVHTIAPGGVATELVSKMRPDINPNDLIQPEAIADVVLFILSLKGNAVIDEIDIRRPGKTPWA